MIGPVIQGTPVLSGIYLVGQAPGPHEGQLGRPFAWTAGKTLFRWFATLGVDEATFRARAYMAAVARCFPGKAKGGGDRKPDGQEIAACRVFLDEEVSLLRPRLVIPVGGLAIEQMLGVKGGLACVIGTSRPVEIAGVRCEAISLPHPSGASTWTKTEPGISLTRKALALLGAHPEWRRTFAR
jgi:uracil-DNA glycosylase